MGKFTKALKRRSVPHKDGAMTEVAIQIPDWAPPELIELASAAMRKALKGINLSGVPATAYDPFLLALIETFVSGYHAGIHPGEQSPGIETGARHLLTIEAMGDDNAANRKLAAKMFRRAAELFELQ